MGKKRLPRGVMRRQPDDLDPAAKHTPGLLETVLENKFIVLGVLAAGEQKEEGPVMVQKGEA